MKNETEQDRTLRMMQLKSLSLLKWSPQQEKKLGQAFSLLDEVLWECERSNKKKELNAIAGARFTIERIVTAFSLKRLVEDYKKDEE